MFNTTTLQARLIAAFVFMGLIVLVVAVVGWSGNFRLSNHINLIGEQAFPSTVGLWKINEGQTQIESSERALLNPRTTLEARKQQITRIKKAWEQINSGFNEYQQVKHTPEEEQLYNAFIPLWNQWKDADEEFLKLNQEFESSGIIDPRKEELYLLRQNKTDSQKMAKILAASDKLDQMNQQQFTKNQPTFQAATTALLQLLEKNKAVAEKARSLAQNDVTQTRFWVIVGLSIGPLTAIVFGIYFSNILAKPLGNKIAGVVGVAERISQGDLTTDIECSNERDEIGKLQLAFRRMTRSLNSLICQVQQSGIQITTSTTQIAASGKQLEATVTEQVASTNQVAATAKEIASTSEELVQTIKEVARVSETTASAAGNGQAELVRMETTMRQLADATSSISSKLGVISEKANNINTVVTTITKVADQTNLLSLNAAIEAEKAGEYGTGFAVVAREIRRLADQTAVATLEIEQMVKGMQSAVSTGVMEMDKFTQEVNRSVQDVRGISLQLAQVIEQVQSLTPRFELVNESMEAQSQGAMQISVAMEQLTEASQQIAESLGDTNQALEQLQGAASGLQREIARFKV